MKIRLAFGQWAESPEAMPTVIAAVDEYTMEEWNALPSWYTKQLEDHQRDGGPVREAVVNVDDELVRRMFVMFALPSEVVEVLGGDHVGSD